MSDFIGPALPPHLLKKKEEKVYNSDVNQASEEQGAKNSFIGSALPFCSGSQEKDVKESDEDNSILELHAEISDEEFRDDCEEESKNVYGPALPPSLISGQSSKAVGPQLPAGHKLKDLEYSKKGSHLIQQKKVSTLSSKHTQDFDSEEGIIGPMPVSESKDAIDYLQVQLDRRAMKMKRKLTGEEEDNSRIPKRESWMLELPPERAEAFGLGPRHFRARAKPDAGDRSVWTDTPADHAKKHTSQMQVEDHRDQFKLEMKAVSERDEAMQHLVDKHNKKKRKKESLLEMHQKELKKKKRKDKEAGKHEERRPFSREIDLQTNRFDEAQKKSILKKAQLLNDRFSSGQSKFL